MSCFTFIFPFPLNHKIASSIVDICMFKSKEIIIDNKFLGDKDVHTQHDSTVAQWFKAWALLFVVCVFLPCLLYAGLLLELQLGYAGLRLQQKKMDGSYLELLLGDRLADSCSFMESLLGVTALSLLNRLSIWILEEMSQACYEAWLIKIIVFVSCGLFLPSLNIFHFSSCPSVCHHANAKTSASSFFLRPYSHFEQLLLFVCICVVVF